MVSRRGVLLGALGTGAGVILAACSRDTAPTEARLPAPTASGTPSATPTAAVAAATSAVPAGPDLVHGPGSAPRIALTFHGAGDPALTRKALDALAAAGALATVMAVGNWLETTPDLARAILAGGHELGNHTWSHQTMPQLAAAAATTEVQRCADVLERLTGSPQRWFRPSGTPTSTPVIRAAAAAAGYGACLSYDLDPRDYEDPGAQLVTSRVLAGVVPGSVVSLHLGHPGTVAALPAMLRGLADRKLTPVTASTLFGIA